MTICSKKEGGSYMATVNWSLKWQNFNSTTSEGQNQVQEPVHIEMKIKETTSSDLESNKGFPGIFNPPQTWFSKCPQCWSTNLSRIPASLVLIVSATIWCFYVSNFCVLPGFPSCFYPMTQRRSISIIIKDYLVTFFRLMIFLHMF